ncbi:MAG TPA: ubiquitin-like small modifier protein 1 [Trebonia sp.]|nr:ubiquitin-like small modifier protein 1 [Trebonia sp.]
MAVTVLVPTVLQQRARGRKSLTSGGSTLDELLDQLARDYADLVAVIRKDGALCRFVNVYRNGEDVRQQEGLRTVLSDGDEIQILPAVAGG